MNPHMSGAAIRLDFRPHVNLVSSARRFVSDFYEHVLGDAETVSRVALATHELLENVVKYSSDGRTHLEIELAERSGRDILRIRARNRTTPERARVLRALVSELEETSDPFALYVQRMRRSAMSEEGSGLGLIRIRAETDMEVRCDVEGDEVTIVVEGEVLTQRAERATPEP